VPKLMPVFSPVFKAEGDRKAFIQANVNMSGGAVDHGVAILHGTFTAQTEDPPGKKEDPPRKIMLRVHPPGGDWTLEIPSYDGGGGLVIKEKPGVFDEGLVMSADSGTWSWLGEFHLKPPSSATPPAPGPGKPLGPPPEIVIEVIERKPGRAAQGDQPAIPDVDIDGQKVTLQPADVWVLAGGEALRRKSKERSGLPANVHVWECTETAPPKENNSPTWTVAKELPEYFPRAFAEARTAVSPLPILLILRKEAGNTIAQWRSEATVTSIVGTWIDPWAERKAKWPMRFGCRGLIWWQGDFDAERDSGLEAKALKVPATAAERQTFRQARAVEVRKSYGKDLLQVMEKWDAGIIPPPLAPLPAGSTPAQGDDHEKKNKWRNGVIRIQKDHQRLVVVQLPSVNCLPEVADDFPEMWKDSAKSDLAPYAKPLPLWAWVRYAQADAVDKLNKDRGLRAGIQIHAPFRKAGPERRRGWITGAELGEVGKELASRLARRDGKPVTVERNNNQVILRAVLPIAGGEKEAPPHFRDLLRTEDGSGPVSAKWTAEGNVVLTFDVSPEQRIQTPENDEVLNLLRDGTPDDPDYCLPAFSLPYVSPP